MPYSQTLCQGLRIAENCSSFASWCPSFGINCLGVGARALVLGAQLVHALFFATRACYYSSRNPQQASRDTLMSINLTVNYMGNMNRLVWEIILLSNQSSEGRSGSPNRASNATNTVTKRIKNAGNQLTENSNRVNTVSREFTRGMANLGSPHKSRTQNKNKIKNYNFIIFFTWDIFNHIMKFRLNRDSSNPPILGRFIEVLDPPKII